jgi:hypothetical protein
MLELFKNLDAACSAFFAQIMNEEREEKQIESFLMNMYQF